MKKSSHHPIAVRAAYSWTIQIGGPMLAFLLALVIPREQTAAHELSAEKAARYRRMSQEAEQKGLAEPFKGITTKGTVVEGLFPIRSTGISTEPIRSAGAAFLQTLSKEQRDGTNFAADDDEWRKWMNQHFYIRQGVSFAEMTDLQREAAVGLMRASLSAKGLKLSRDVMRLNHTLGELTSNFVEYGEGFYWITVMGTPSASEPWGWQLEGHHLVINYFIFRDQVVMTPSFWGSEPVIAKVGKYKGVAILQDEQNEGLALINALSEAQRGKAVLSFSKTGNNNLTEAFKDNVVLEYAGIGAAELSPAQRRQLLKLIGLYVNNTTEGHAKIRMEEVLAHLNETHFAWIGGTESSSVFYYRIHSPVILIELDHQTPIALGDRRAPPSREHIHVVVRTPNGGDYGKDLLREHYKQHPHPHSHR